MLLCSMARQVKKNLFIGIPCRTAHYYCGKTHNVVFDEVGLSLGSVMMMEKFGYPWDFKELITALSSTIRNLRKTHNLYPQSLRISNFFLSYNSKQDWVEGENTIAQTIEILYVGPLCYSKEGPFDKVDVGQHCDGFEMLHEDLKTIFFVLLDCLQIYCTPKEWVKVKAMFSPKREKKLLPDLKDMRKQLGPHLSEKAL
jgi:hypothetical protein